MIRKSIFITIALGITFLASFLWILQDRSLEAIVAFTAALAALLMQK